MPMSCIILWSCTCCMRRAYETAAVICFPYRLCKSEQVDIYCGVSSSIYPYLDFHGWSALVCTCIWLGAMPVSKNLQYRGTCAAPGCKVTGRHAAWGSRPQGYALASDQTKRICKNVLRSKLTLLLCRVYLHQSLFFQEKCLGCPRK
jgi:hypothetical protein